MGKISTFLDIFPTDRFPFHSRERKERRFAESRSVLAFSVAQHEALGRKVQRPEQLPRDGEDDLCLVAAAAALRRSWKCQFRRNEITDSVNSNIGKVL